VLALAVIGLLAVASHADTAVRVPGTTLRFGLADSVLSARGFTAAEAGTRQGPCRFFGLVSQAKLGFETGRLARAEFKVEDASAYEADYVEDQLTAMGYRKTCTQNTPRNVVCDWTARTQIHLERAGGSLKATVVPAAPAPPPAASPASPPAMSRVPAPTLAPSAAPPAAASPVAPPTASPAAPPAAASPAPARLPARVAVTAADGVPVLPDTLEVPLAGRPAPRAPATVLSQPRCRYPEAAGAAGVQGRVWVLALVGTDGRVMRAQVSRGIRQLDAAALACVKGWTFQPASWKGAPCRFWALVPVPVTAD
jgi:TonB family protein